MLCFFFISLRIIGQRTYSLLIRIGSTMYECIYLEDLFRPKLYVKRDGNILTTSVANALRGTSDPDPTNRIGTV
jgi:hypothetical protein